MESNKHGCGLTIKDKLSSSRVDVTLKYVKYLHSGRASELFIGIREREREDKLQECKFMAPFACAYSELTNLTINNSLAATLKLFIE